MPRRPDVRTLRHRLLLFISWPLLVLLGASMVADYRSALGIAGEAYDNALARTAIALGVEFHRGGRDDRLRFVHCPLRQQRRGGENGDAEQS